MKKSDSKFTEQLDALALEAQKQYFKEAVAANMRDLEKFKERIRERSAKNENRR